MKTTIKTGFAALLLLLAISCKKESVSTPAVSIKTEDNAAIITGPHRIGDHYGGGIIFWVNRIGSHGLIADTVDLGLATWWNGTYTTTGATATAIGTGKANTRKIILSQGKPGSYAALLCANYKGGGYTDWVLPSKDELNELYKQKKWLADLVIISIIGVPASTISTMCGLKFLAMPTSITTLPRRRPFLCVQFVLFNYLKLF